MKGKISLGISLVILLSVVAILYLSNPPWDTPNGAISFYSVLAFLCVTMTASAATKTRTDPSPSNKWFTAGTGYAAIIFCGAAILYTYTNESPVAHTSTSGIFLNLVAFATAGTIIFMFSYIETHEVSKTSVLYNNLVVPVVISVGTVIFVLMLIISRIITDQLLFLVAGYITGSIAVVTFLGAGYLMYSLRNSESVHDTGRLTLSFWLLAVASANHTLILPAPSSLWIISMGLLIISFFYANVAISYTYLLNVGVKRTIAYGISIFLSIVVVVPFIAVRLLDSYFHGALFIDFGAKILIHLLAAILAGSSAYVFYARLRYSPSPGQTWVIILLLYWTAAELVLMMSNIVPGYGLTVETKVPYISGAVVSVILIAMSVKSILNPYKMKDRRWPPIFVLAFILSFVLIGVSEILRTYVLSITGLTLSTTIDAGMMLSFGYLSMFVILIYGLLVSSASGGRLSFDSLGAGLATIWVVITIIKVNYEMWTIGWWSAEIVLIVSIIVYLIIVVRFYLNEVNKSTTRENVAIAFSSYLSGLVASHQSAAIDSLSDISKDTTISDSALNTVSNALSDISRANELSQHMDIFVSGREFQDGQIGPISIKDSLSSGLDNAGLASAKQFVVVQEEGQSIELKMEKDCLVLGNSFLIDAFQNLLLGISRHIGPFDNISIKIRGSTTDDSLCKVEMNLSINVEDSDNALELFERYIREGSLSAIEIAYSKRIFSLFGGSMDIKAMKKGEKIISAEVSIQLLKA